MFVCMCLCVLLFVRLSMYEYCMDLLHGLRYGVCIYIYIYTHGICGIDICFVSCIIHDINCMCYMLCYMCISMCYVYSIVMCNVY